MKNQLSKDVALAALLMPHPVQSEELYEQGLEASIAEGVEHLSNEMNRLIESEPSAPAVKLLENVVVAHAHAEIFIRKVMSKKTKPGVVYGYSIYKREIK